jgi:hypothetical protein
MGVLMWVVPPFHRGPIFLLAWLSGGDKEGQAKKRGSRSYSPATPGDMNVAPW